MEEWNYGDYGEVMEIMENKKPNVYLIIFIQIS